MKNLIKALLLIVLLLLSINTFSQDGNHYGATETFEYWAGEEPWEGVEVLNGQYWSSAHWTKEYILYMEVKVPVKMAVSFIEANNLQITDDDVKFPSDAPDWFNPPKESVEYKAGGQGSKYFINSETEYIFMYEIQL